MNIDKDTLRALAEACKDHQPLRFMRSHGALYIRNDNGIVFDVHQNRSFPEFVSQNKDYADLVLACTPGTILALLAENEVLHKDAERSKRMLLDACVSIGSIGEALGLDMDADADMMIGTACDLIDGLNRIIKECPLGSPGFAIATEVLGELGVQQEAQP